MTEWKLNGTRIMGETESGIGWRTQVTFSWVPAKAPDPEADLLAVARLMHAAPKLRDMVTDLIAWLEPWARLDTGEKYREVITAARELLREIEGRRVMHTITLTAGFGYLLLGSFLIAVRDQPVERAVIAAGAMISGAILIVGGLQ
jgi:hypothetical protein